MSAHLDRLGVAPERRGEYLDAIAEARRLCRVALALEGATARSRVADASVLLSLELDRVGGPKLAPPPPPGDRPLDRFERALGVRPRG